MNVIKVAILLAGILSLMPILTKAASDDCLSHAELIETDSRELTAESACDDIGRAYVMGVKGTPIRLPNEESFGEVSYYFLTRTYLFILSYADSARDQRSAYGLLPAEVGGFGASTFIKGLTKVAASTSVGLISGIYDITGGGGVRRISK